MGLTKSGVVMELIPVVGGYDSDNLSSCVCVSVVLKEGRRVSLLKNDGQSVSIISISHCKDKYVFFFLPAESTTCKIQVLKIQVLHCKR
jgi:hypothetical protein